MAKNDSDLFDRLRHAGVRKRVAKTLSGIGEDAGKQAVRGLSASRCARLRVERRLPIASRSRAATASQGRRAPRPASNRRSPDAPTPKTAAAARTNGARAPRGQNKAKILASLKAGPKTAIRDRKRNRDRDRHSWQHAQQDGNDGRGRKGRPRLRACEVDQATIEPGSQRSASTGDRYVPDADSERHSAWREVPTSASPLARGRTSDPSALALAELGSATSGWLTVAVGAAASELLGRILLVPAGTSASKHRRPGSSSSS